MYKQFALITTIAAIVFAAQAAAQPTVSPSALAFTASPPPQTLTFSSPVTVGYTAVVTSDPPAWLRVQPIQGDTSTTVTVSIVPGAPGLTFGATYRGNIQFTMADGSGTVINVPVTMADVPDSFCVLSANPGGTTTPANGTSTNGFYPSLIQSVTVASSPQCQGSNWTATSDSPWLQVVVPTAGTISGIISVRYVVLSNSKSGPRVGNITIAPGPFSGTAAKFQVTEAASSQPTTVRQVLALYQQLLGREPDQAGFNFWTGQGGAALGQMADSFLISQEAVVSDFVVMAVYQAALNRAPSFAEYTKGLTGIRSNSQDAATLYASLLGSSEYASKFGSSTDNTSFVTNLYQHLLGRAPTSSELTAAVGQLTSGQSQYNIFFNLFGGAEFRNTGSFNSPSSPDHTNPLYVTMLYFLILGRDIDSGGLNFWTGVANSGGPGIYFNSLSERIEILGIGQPGEGFIGSQEFQGLFQ
ncbi:MAG TPA: DUF4214 domain-containing protein [Bryobacteraceae bacterium]|nr:DUF4214 domain-containing protein [Bryobacteraceae bacterium]